MTLNGDLISGQSWQASNTNVTALAEISYWKKIMETRNPPVTYYTSTSLPQKTIPEEMLAPVIEIMLPIKH